MSSSSPVRVALAGVGGIAVMHLTNLLRIPNAEVVGLADIEHDRCRLALARAAANQTPPQLPPEVPVFDDVTQMLRKVAPDAVFILLPPEAHGEIDLACIEAGKHLLVQKPVALDLALARSIQRAIEERGLITSVGYQMRYANTVAEARAALGDRTIGMALGTYLGGLPGTPWWRVQARSGGQVVEQATHVVDLMRFVVGEVESVYALAARRLLTDVPELDIADVSTASMRFKSGAIGSLVNTCALRGVPHEDWDYGLTLVAQDLSVRMWLDSARIARPGEVRTLQATESADYALDAAFINAVAARDASGILSTYADAVATLQVTLAIEESVRTGQPVRPADLG